MLNFYIKLRRFNIARMHIFGDQLRHDIGIFRKRVFDHLAHIGFNLLIDGVEHKPQHYDQNQTKEKPNAHKDRQGISPIKLNWLKLNQSKLFRPQ